MWVSPSARGLNIGLNLVKALLSHALYEGYSSVVLNVSVDNVPAYRLYKKSGFVVANEKHDSNSQNDINLKKMIWHHSDKSCKATK